MDRYQQMMRYDIRLLKRKVRNHVVTDAEIEEYRESLPDVSENARFLSQNGEECGDAYREELLRLHKDGWDKVLSGEEELIDPTPVEASKSAEPEESEASKSVDG